MDVMERPKLPPPRRQAAPTDRGTNAWGATLGEAPATPRPRLYSGSRLRHQEMRLREAEALAQAHAAGEKPRWALAHV